MVELLSPVGNFESLKAAVQNGADAVYFGANFFSARAFADNFDIDFNLENAINYAKLRGVKTHLTLNTLIKNNEFDDAINLAKKAYESGIDAIIVQDLGLASQIKEFFPDLPIHASTQMTTHNLEGVLELGNLGFERVVLSRELSLSEIQHICKNSKTEIEVFIHGALCICYSGQCLFSSMVGGRSGNRGKCAQPCRLPYELLENNKKIDKGYLLSTRDLCGLEFIPSLIKAGVTSFKVEGRMKSPEYVATVTRIYRKYIDLAQSNKPYIIEEQDKKDLMQVFNRGGFSNGHLEDKPNKDLIFKEKQNNMGIFLGKVKNINPSKGLITLDLKDTLEIGDSISLQNEGSTYTVSELMNKNQNIKIGSINQEVTIGRMKGNINIDDKIYKITNKSLKIEALNSFSKEFKKIPLECTIFIKKDNCIKVKTDCLSHNMQNSFEYNYIPLPAENKPLDKEKIIAQFSKTGDTCFEFRNLNIELDDGLFLPVSVLNELRRTTISNIEEKIIKSFKRTSNFKMSINNLNSKKQIATTTFSLLLNELNLEFDYSKIENVNRIYIPLRFFLNNNYSSIISVLSNKFDTYIYLPTIIKEKNIESTINILNKSISNYKITGLVLSNISQLQLLDKLYHSNLNLIANYTFNVYNNYTVQQLKDFEFKTITISPELDKYSIIDINKYDINSEYIVYGKTPLMTINYCLLGNSNKCHTECNKSCSSDNKYYLRDRLNINFRIIPDNTSSITTIYNSKTTSITYDDLNINSVRIDILDENIDEINDIINRVRNNQKFEGKDFTNGNLNREI